MSRAEHAEALDHPAVTIEALDCADHDRFTWEGGDNITRISSRWSTIWDRTDFTVADADYASLYDGFSVFVLCWLEELLQGRRIRRVRCGPGSDLARWRITDQHRRRPVVRRTPAWLRAPA